VSFVLLPAAALPSADDFRAAWRDIVKGAAAPAETRWDADSAAVELDGTTTVVTLMPFPVPNGEAEAAAPRSLSAMRAQGVTPATHVAHLAVASIAPTGSPVERLLRHTRVVAAFAKACKATGVYEGNAGATHDPAFYVDVVSSGGDRLPLMLWNGISLAKTADTVELLTLGMGQLGLPDLLLVAPPGQGNASMLFGFDLLSYVVSRGSPIPEGETVGRTAAEKLPVTYVPSPVDSTVRVMKVELPRKKKSLWPFGGN
jgi:hypothetical protein